ncbi:MAG: hypothetical protein IJP70_05040 [Bacteroidales bacterium]|nr:hypothetical protein [Bacteroidales bacterium]
MAKHCVVAGLHFVIDTDDKELLDVLAQRYAIFSRSASAIAGVPVLFTLSQTERFEPLADAHVMSEFECEGAWCVYSETDTQVQISLLDEKTREPQAQMQSDNHFREARCWLSGEVWQREYCYNNFLMMLFAFASMDQQTLLFHASVIERNGKAYLFLAKSGTGKSTHSTLWLTHVPGCQLVNDDNPAVGIRNGEVIVYGTPWSGKTPCYRDIQFPVGGFVQITRDATNHIQRDGVVPSFAALLTSCSGVKWDKRLYRAQGDTISTIVGKVPVYTLGCTPYREAAVVCAQGVGAWNGESDGDFEKNSQSMKPSGVKLPEER